MFKNKKAFTLIELIVVIFIIGLLASFIVTNLSGSRSLAQDAVRKNDISNIYKSIVGKKATAEVGKYYEGTAAIKQGETPADLQSFINQFLKTTPYDPNPSKAYLYTSNGKDFSLAAILDDGTCFIKSTGVDLFTSDVCATYMQGGLGLVSNFMIIHGNLIDVTWSIPEEFVDSPEGDISTAIVCVSSSTELTESELPSDSELITNGTIVGIANNKTDIYRITPDNPSYYYYCKAITYDETVVSNPGTVGSTPNTGSGGFSSGSSGSGYSSSSPSTYSFPEVSAAPANIGGGGGGGSSGGGTTSSSFIISDPVRLPDGKGSLTLRWKPALGSTATLIRRLDNIPPETEAPKTRTEGTEVTLYPNKPDSTEWHTYTDDNGGAGLDELHIYCYSAWGFDSSSSTYSPGFVLACGAVPAADPVSMSLTPQKQYIDINWNTSIYRALIRRQIGVAPQKINEGISVYNGTGSTYRDLSSDDTPLMKDTTYCYSIWSINSVTGAISNNHLEQCSGLIEVGDTTNIQTSNLTTGSVKLTWTKAIAATHTVVRRLPGTVPPIDRTQGTEVYNNTGNEYTDISLSSNTDYCYSVWGYDEVTGSYSKNRASVCIKTLEIVNGACGTANKIYLFTDSSYSNDTFCLSGNPTPSSPLFPSAGATISWTCTGMNGGTTASCSAQHLAGSVVYSESTDGLYTVGTFNLVGSGSASTSWTPPSSISSLEVLVVGAGGGSPIGSSGGGGGGVIHHSSYSVSGSINVVVGDGVYGGNGQNSSFGSLVAIGGGRGVSSGSGIGGGSGGGGRGATSYIGGLSTQSSPSGGNGYGNTGGSGSDSITACGGGGGGAGGPGLAPTTTSTGGAGGPGLSFSITGEPTYYAGGGGGDSNYYGGSPSSGGIGGGGSGCYVAGVWTNSPRIPGTNGAQGTGGGGGGGNNSSSTKGGSGIVIIRYLTPQ